MARPVLLALGLALATAAARADDYTDVQALQKSGQTGEALARADRHIAARPNDPQMRFVKAGVLSAAGRADEAEALLVQLTRDYPELPEPYNNLAVLYAGQSQFDKARAALEMAIRTNPSYATAHENLGDVYAKLASQAYSKALQLDSNNTGVQPKLALIRDLFAPAPKGAAAKPVVVAANAPASRPAAAAPPAAAPAPAPVSAPAAAPVAAAPAKVASAPTPAKAASAPVPASAPAAAAGADKAVEEAVNAWAAAWAAKDMTRYLAAYGKDFDPPGSQSRKAWEEERRVRIVGKSRITLKLTDMRIEVEGNKARARFRQDYDADTLSVTSRKTLELVKAGDRWVIVKESTGG